MKNLIYFFIFLLIFTACHSNVSDRIVVDEFPLNQVIVPTVMLTDSVILAPDAMFLMNNQLWIFQRKKNVFFDVFDISDYSHLYSVGMKGQGPNDFIFPLGTTIQAENNFFTILDGNILKTVVCPSNREFRIIKSQKTFEQFPVNGFIKLNDSLCCSFADCATNTIGNYEYQMLDMYNGRNYKFSDYPEFLSKKKFDQETRCQVFSKYIVSNPVKKKFASFYNYYKFIRFYSYDRILEKEITINISPFQIDDVENWKERFTFYGKPISTNKYIYVSCYANKGEIQVWDWDGNPIICYCLDRTYSTFTVSEEQNKIYLTSLAENDLNKIYVFEMTHL